VIVRQGRLVSAQDEKGVGALLEQLYGPLEKVNLTRVPQWHKLGWEYTIVLKEEVS